MQEDKLSLYEPIYNKSLGQHEGVGMLLRMGRLDTKNTGSITPEEERGKLFGCSYLDAPTWYLKLTRSLLLSLLRVSAKHVESC